MGDDHPPTLEHDADPLGAEAAALARDVLHGVTDVALIGRAFTPNRLGIDTNQAASPVSSDFYNTPFRMDLSSMLSAGVGHLQPAVFGLRLVERHHARPMPAADCHSR